MTDYEKLATVIFRIIGCFFFVSAIVVGLLCFTAPFFDIYFNQVVLIFLFYAIPLTIFGSVFWFLSKRFAKFVCKGLD